MDAIELVKRDLELAHSVTEQTMEGLTTDQLHFVPPGLAHSIASTYAHIVGGEDFFVQGVILAGRPIMAGEWATKMGLSEPVPTGGDWAEWAKRVRVNLDQLRQYAHAVNAATDSYLASATPQELDRQVTLPFEGFGSPPVAVVFGMLTQHINAHTGEIAAIKGIQGLRGYPF